MLKKTTVYLSEEDITLLRKKAAVRQITVAEAIRVSIQEACQPKTKEEKAIWNTLDEIWSKLDSVSPIKIESAVCKAVKEVRGDKKTNRRS